MKVGFIAIIGRPNVGKSSLMNKLLDFKVSITSEKPQTTRDQIKGVYNDEASQIVFIDTPGIHKPKQKFGETLNSASYKSLQDVEAIMFLQPVDEKVGPGDKFILDKIKFKKNKIAVITKVDKIDSPDKIIKRKEELSKYNFDLIVSTSIKNMKSVTSLIQDLKKYLNEGIPYYNSEDVTDVSMRFIAKEIIREAAIEKLKHEIPHSIAITIEEYKEKDKKISIDAFIFVEKNSQKGILVGKNGLMIKNIKLKAQKRINDILGKKINLNLYVKVSKNWTSNLKQIKMMGY